MPPASQLVCAPWWAVNFFCLQNFRLKSTRQAPALAVTAAIVGGMLFTPSNKPHLPTPTKLERASVFGHDDRLPFNTDAEPWRAIGRIDLLPEGVSLTSYSGGYSFCTGSLVGKDLVLTNAHCVLDPKTGELSRQTIWFRPGYSHLGAHSLASRAARVWLGSLLPDSQRAEDWAIIKLEESLGASVGWLEVRPYTLQNLPHMPFKTTLISYAMDFQNGALPAREDNCEVTGFDFNERYLRHNCDMNAGASGSPILWFEGDKPYIAGINAAHMSRDKVSYVDAYSFEQTNVGVAAPYFAEMITLLQTEAPLTGFQSHFAIELSKQPSPLGWPSSYPVSSSLHSSSLP